MIGYPYTYNDGDEHKVVTSDTVFNKISQYCSDEKTQENFRKGYRVGLITFGFVSLFILSPTAAFAEGENVNNGVGPNNSANSCPGAGSGPSGTAGSTPNPPASPIKNNALANMPAAEQGGYVASALGICAMAMKSSSWYIGFLCAGAVIIGMRIANANANP